MLWAPRVLNYLLLGVKSCVYLLEITLGWQTMGPKVEKFQTYKKTAFNQRNLAS